MAGTVHRRTHNVPTRLGWVAGWIAPVSVYDGPLYRLQVRPGQTMTRRDRAYHAMPGQAKDSISQPFGEESGSGRVVVVCVMYAAGCLSDGRLPTYLGGCLGGLVLLWGRRGGERVLQASLYGSQVRVSRTMEGRARTGLDREAGR
jgi:hypothetical protein